jgi:4-amino-4-deoxy-L-arabinose transferase-like glycosyltransferase
LKPLLLGVILYCLFFHGLGSVGLLGPDEPRFAAIGREMARSGDWITPRLWGEPWFEKPALLYWMTGVGFRVGLSQELAPRLPVALLSAGFLLFYYWILRREFNSRAAFFATAILATSAAWLSFSRVGVTDLPMAATFSAAMLLCLPETRGQATGSPVLAAALLGLAVLAKGLVPLVLALPLAWILRRRLAEWLRPAPLAAFLVVAAPWYVLCTLANGAPFLTDFFLKHHLSRFSTDALQHQQPFWFYLPVLLAGLFPWTPLVALLFRKSAYQDPRRRFLLLWLLFGLVFFSASLNKLPGYLLPLIPAASALAGLALAEIKQARWALTASALLLLLGPVIARMLPQALASGLTHVTVSGLRWPLFLPALALAGLVWWQETKGHRRGAVCSMVAATTAGVIWLAATTFPALDRLVSARGFWRQIAGRAAEVCVEEANRGWLYNLNYYSGTPLPACEEESRKLHLKQEPGSAPALAHWPQRKPGE